MSIWYSVLISAARKAPAVEDPRLTRAQPRDQIAERRLEVDERLVRVRDLARQHEASPGHLAQVQGGVLADRPLPGLASGRGADQGEALDLGLPAARARRDLVAPLAVFPSRDPDGIAQGRGRLRPADDAVAENLEQLDSGEAR